jgi:hypothetical protein
MKLTILLLPLAALLSACGAQTPAAGNRGASTKSPSDVVPRQRDADDAARFLAGMPGNAGSPFAELENEAAWKEHRRLMDAAWQKADADIVQGLRDFQKKELGGGLIESAPVFYPFGGPDALAVTLFFPRNPAYVLVSLEPSGTLPTVAKMRKKPLESYLGATRATVGSELGRSFFITREMDRELRGQVADGVLSPILHLLVRTNHTILGYRYVRVNEEGQMVERPAGVAVAGDHPNKGVEVEFRSDADQSIHKLYYFTVNLSDQRLRGNEGFLKYVAGLKGAVTLLKATSYMTHKANFSVIRDLVLSSSAAVLQDDSGIPYRCFEANLWNVQLYGDYTRPYGSFKWMQQSDLRKAYAAGGAKPLDMRVGYGFHKIASNLLLARRASATP